MVYPVMGVSATLGGDQVTSRLVGEVGTTFSLWGEGQLQVRLGEHHQHNVVTPGTEVADLGLVFVQSLAGGAATHLLDAFSAVKGGKWCVNDILLMRCCIIYSLECCYFFMIRGITVG